MIGRAALGSLLLFMLSTASVSAGVPLQVEMKNYFFDPATRTISVGDAIDFHNGSGLTHTTTADLFNRWNRTIPTGSTDQVGFPTAGTFAFHCTIHDQMTGKVKVRMDATPPTGTAGMLVTLRVAWENAPAGFTEDVQKRKAGKAFKNWKHVTGQTISWIPASAGTWEFRARLRKTSNGVHTGWGPALTVNVN